MNKLTIERQNGNILKTLEGQDHVSGLLFYVAAAADVPSGFKTQPVQGISTLDAAKDAGITADASSWAVKVMHYQIGCAVAQNPGVTLYVGVYQKGEAQDFAEIKAMQNFAAGAIRQIGIWDGTTAMTAAAVTKIQAQADACDAEGGAPLVVLYASKVSSVGSLPQDVSGSCPRVSVVIAEDCGADVSALRNDTGNKTAKNSVTAIGTALGQLSKASVEQSISWVKEFPTGVSVPGFADGTLVRDTDRSVLEQLDAARYLFMMTVTGISGSYWNDSHNMDAATSDYSAIENVRTMDKACRGIRTYLTPELGGNVYVDAGTGKLQAYSVKHLETVAQKALEDMEKAGELSGYKVAIDPEQNVLSTSRIEVVIQNVPVGVARKINVKIGFVTETTN